MFETIREEIENLPKYDFSTYFLLYVMKVQDECIAAELSYMLSHNIVDVMFVDRELADAARELSQL